MMPFYGLEGQELANEIRSGSDDQRSKLNLKLRKASKTIKSLEIENQALLSSKIVSEYDQEIPQSQTADNPWHREEEQLNHHKTSGRQIKQTLSWVLA